MDYILPTQLADERAKFLVVDVRDEDYDAKWRVPGSVNFPSETFGDDAMSELADLAHGKDAIVFHCMYSQQRGPTCARMFAAKYPEVTVKVLRGGYQGWREMEQCK